MSSGDFIQSLERGLSVMAAFAEDRPAMTVSELASETGLSRPSVRRIVLTLLRLGYMKSDGRRFSLTPQVLNLGYAYISSLNTAEIAQPYLEMVSEQVHESSSMGVLDGTEIVYVARIPTSRIMTISLGLGSRLPAYCTSMGRVLLAGLAEDALDEFFAAADLRPLTDRTVTDPARLRATLDEVREQGWALVDQELELGVRSIAAPLRDRTCTIAAMNVSAHAGRVSLARLRKEFLPLVLDAAAKISDLLAQR
jgi:IclR family transcriptional regulator, pca regulon regulatory protein